MTVEHRLLTLLDRAPMPLKLAIAIVGGSSRAALTAAIVAGTVSVDPCEAWLSEKGVERLDELDAKAV